MKYSDANKPLQCMQTQSTCYKGTTTMTPKGVLWHSTGANNPTIKRYVQPSDNDPDREKLLAIIGKNTNGNDWNHIQRDAGLNCWIGKLADGTVATVQTMPWNFRPWGCGSGSKGSCNSGWVQFEICEDGLTDPDYFRKVYQEACEITAYLCKLYNIDPHGTVTVNGVKIPTILCHQDSYQLGFGSNHGDVLHWFPKHGKSMEDARKDVAALLGAAAPSTPSSGTTGTTMYRVRKSWADAASQLGAYTVLANAKAMADKNPGYSVYDGDGKAVYPIATSAPATSYLVRVSVDDLNIRTGPGTDYPATGSFTGKGTFTIVEESAGTGSTSGWGKLKSGAGWISLDFAKKI